MRLGVFGGSFDPVHYGHLLLADSAREQLGLQRVLLVPAAQSPLKTRGPRASDAARLEMLRLAIADTPGLETSDLEISRGGKSYTLDTLRSLKQQMPDAELFLIVGTDQLADLQHWHQPQEISNLATWAFVRRPGSIDLDWTRLEPFATASQLQAAQRSVIQMPAWELSSSELRQRLEQQRSIRFRTPRAVEEYIRANQLYKDPASTGNQDRA